MDLEFIIKSEYTKMSKRKKNMFSLICGIEDSQSSCECVYVGTV